MPATSEIIVLRSRRGIRPLRPGGHGLAFLGRDACAGEGLIAIIRACVADYLTSETTLIETGKPRSFHASRVALRKLRTGFSLFRLRSKGHVTQPLMNDLSALADGLGAVRSLDVFAAGALRRASGRQPAIAGLPAIEAAVSRQRDALCEAFQERARRGEGRAVMERALVVADRLSVDVVLRRRSLARTLAKRLSKWQRRARRDMKRIEDLSDEQRHDIRVLVKKIRYGAEFQATLCGQRLDKRHIRACDRVQSRFGALNDISAEGRLLHQVALAGSGAPSVAVAFSAGELSASLRNEVPRLLKKAARSSRKFRAVEPDWTQDHRTAQGNPGRASIDRSPG